MGPPFGPGDQVVHVAYGRWLGAAWELAVLVALDDGGAQVRRDGAGGAAEVQWLAGGVERGAEQGAAQLGGEPAGPGQKVEAPAQDGGLQPLPGGLQAAGYCAVPAVRGGGGPARAQGVAGAGARAVAGAGERDVAGAGGWLVRVAVFPRSVGVVFRAAVGVVFRAAAGMVFRAAAGMVFRPAVRLAFPRSVRVVFRSAAGVAVAVGVSQTVVSWSRTCQSI